MRLSTIENTLTSTGGSLPVVRTLSHSYRHTIVSPLNTTLPLLVGDYQYDLRSKREEVYDAEVHQTHHFHRNLNSPRTSPSRALVSSDSEPTAPPKPYLARVGTPSEPQNMSFSIARSTFNHRVTDNDILSTPHPSLYHFSPPGTGQRKCANSYRK
ncbi:hypothetical protein EDB87DRAFT_1651595 [Lactarius vividus]|nr:hypothetical protein EDB87DRAFT_1651595 [Lactarius vividus]